MSSAAAGVPTVIGSVEDALSRVGQLLGTSDWHAVTQEMVNQFAQATGDLQWIHVDPVRAAHGPFGGCIAHGLLTLSLAGGALFHETVKVQASMGVNYGCDRVRYPAPVPVGSRLRAAAQLMAATAIETDGVQLLVRITVDLEGSAKPACIADFVVRYYF